MRNGIFILLFISGVTLAEYNVPVADDQEGSMPSITGIISSVSGNVATISTGQKTYSVLINNETSIFTEFGGIVFINQLCTSDPIEVWYASENPSIPTDHAVAIRVQKKCM